MFSPEIIFLNFKNLPELILKLFGYLSTPIRSQFQKLLIDRVCHDKPIHKFILVDNVGGDVFTCVIVEGL
jgi:hypothetical protein